MVDIRVIVSCIRTFFGKKLFGSMQLILLVSIIFVACTTSMQQSTRQIKRKDAHRGWSLFFDYLGKKKLTWCNDWFIDKRVVRFNDAIKERIKMFMCCRCICIYFDMVLTDTMLMNLCKEHRPRIGTIENHELKDMLSTLYKTITKTFDSYLDFESIRLPVLLFLSMASDVDDIAMDFLSQGVLCKDASFVDTVLKFDHIQRKKDEEEELFTYATTREMAQTLIDNRIDVHSAFSKKFVQPIIRPGSSLDLMKFYITIQDVDINKLAGTLTDGSCLLHKLVYHPFASKDTIEKVRLILNAQPDMVDIVDAKGRTPLDLIELRMLELKKAEATKHRKRFHHNANENLGPYYDIFKQLIDILFIEYKGTYNILGS
jgi:hypothetical protein